MIGFTSSFLGCWLLDRVFYSYSNNAKFSNVLTCWVYQVYFLLNTLRLLIRSSKEDSYTLCIETEKSLDTLSGYFFYDMFAILFSSFGLMSFGYLFHHILGITMIQSLKYLGITPPHVFYYNLYCFIAEFQNPFSQMFILSHETKYEKISRTVYFYVYALFRVILFPIVNRVVYAKNRTIQVQFAQVIFVCSDLIYIASLFYFAVLWKSFYN